jgi:DNA-binding transcriptional ArsR family regulator
VLLEKVQALRSWGKENLPLYESVIANDLIIFLAIEFVSGKPLTVKRLFASLPYSYTAVRQHYKKLFEDGWVIHVPDENDRRIKYIKPSEKFIEVIDAYVGVIKNTFITPPPHYSQSFQHDTRLASPQP